MTMLTRGKSEASTRHLVVPARRRVFTQTAQISGTVANQAKGSEITPMSISLFSNQELPLPIASRDCSASMRPTIPTGIQMIDARMGMSGPAPVD